MGRFHRSCVYDVGNGAQIDASGRAIQRDGATVQYAPCKYKPRGQLARPLAPRADGLAGPEATNLPPPVTDGWAEHVSGFANVNSFGFNWINGLASSWPVPPAPIQFTDQIVYLFSGAEPTSGASIIQPVLQYGTTPAGGGRFWGIASWFVSSGGNALHSTLMQVSVGDTIQGTLFSNNCSASGVCGWTIATRDDTKNISTALSVTTTEPYRWVNKAVLETYRISNCNKLPVPGVNGEVFSNVTVFMPGPTVNDFNGLTKPAWATTVNVSGCTFGVIDTDRGAQLFWN
jgi:hypothetical protein